MKKTLAVLSVFTLLTACQTALAPAPTPPPVAVNPNPIVITPNPVVEATASYKDLITVSAPISNSTVTSPLSIIGEARGSWYFEASFPIELRDANGVVLTQTAAKASGDWMSTDYVPFTATLTFTMPSTATGTLILKKDNPSGDPARDEQLEIPVQFY